MRGHRMAPSGVNSEATRSSLLRRGPPANTAFTDGGYLERTLRRGLGHIQLRPDLIDGCLATTGLTRTQQPRTTRGSR